MRPFFWLGRHVVVVILLSCLNCSQSAAAAAQQAEPSKAGARLDPAQAAATIRGRVVDQIGAVMGGATVLFRDMKSGGCDIEGGTAEFMAVTDQYGQFSVAVAPRIYGVWVQGMRDCTEVTLDPASPPLTLKVNLAREDQEVDPSLPESRYKKIAGPAAINCGRVGIGKDRAPA